jgi:tRNA(Arg) A34 adenosine deaminase TadA
MKEQQQDNQAQILSMEMDRPFEEPYWHAEIEGSIRAMERDKKWQWENEFPQEARRITQ